MQRRDPTPKVPAIPTRRGGPWPNGSWNHETDGTGWFERLLRMRCEGAPPAEIASEIIVLGRQEAFPNFHSWLECGWFDISDRVTWPGVPCSSSAEERIKRCGRPTQDHDWHNGYWIPNELIPPRQPPIHRPCLGT